MTIKRKIEIEIEISSSVSEADLERHMDSIVGEIKTYTEELKYDSWRNEIYTSYDESEPVEILVDFKCK